MSRQLSLLFCPPGQHWGEVSGQVFGAVHFEGLVVVLQISASQSLLIMSYQISAVKQAVFQVYVKSYHTYSISSFIFYLRC